MNREQQIDKEIEALEEEREQLRARKLFQCFCGKKSRLDKWILISDHHYIRPRGCSGGDYWAFSKEYHLVCPKCGGMGRVIHRSWAKDDPKENASYNFVHEYRQYFGERLNAYGDGYTVEELRKKKKESEERRSIY